MRPQPVEPANGGLLDRLERLKEVRIAVISPQAIDKYPELRNLIGENGRQIEKGWLIILPNQGSSVKLEDILPKLISTVETVTFLQYGNENEFDDLRKMVLGLSNVNFLGPYSLQGTDFHEVLRQILANLAGLEEGTISETDLKAVEELLGLQV